MINHIYEQLRSNYDTIPDKCVGCSRQSEIAAKVAGLITDQQTLTEITPGLMGQRFNNHVASRMPIEQAEQFVHIIRVAAGKAYDTLTSEIEAGRAEIMTNAANCHGRPKVYDSQRSVEGDNTCVYSRVYDNQI